MLKLGIIQLSIQEGNIEKNCAHIEELVRKHSSDDIDLLSGTLYQRIQF